MARAVIQAKVVSRPVAGRAGRTEMMAAMRPIPFNFPDNLRDLLIELWAGRGRKGA